MSKKAVSLISGGLDSMLATKLILDQRIEVEGINFFTGFCVEGHTQSIRNETSSKPKRNNALWVANTLGIKLHIIDVIEEYKQVLLNPKHGYGKNMNPCLDCKGFMVKKAKEWAIEKGFDFIITGEVIGQRPMSQRKNTMPIIAKESGANDLLLRPLCAQHLPQTLPEREGWVNREELKDFSGRDRKPQIALAKHYGFDDYATPSGGCCFLTDKVYSDKLVDMWQSRGEKTYELDDLIMLKVGRHIRPKPHFKLIIARDGSEVKFLTNYQNQYTYICPMSHSGSIALIEGDAALITKKDLELSARILARYTKGKEEAQVTMAINTHNISYNVDVAPFTDDSVIHNWLI